MKVISSVVFDFDGTLVDSARGILATLDMVLQRNGLLAQVELRREIVGPPLKQTLQQVSGCNDEARLQTLAAEFKEAYDSMGYLDADPYPGIGDCLIRLQESELPLHLATNKRGLPTRKILDHLGWTGYFTSVYCLDEHPADADKPAMLKRLVAEQNLDAPRSLFIGDTPPDAIAAHANAMPFLAVSWGYGMAAAWEAETRFCNDPHSLVDAILNAFEQDMTCPAR